AASDKDRGHYEADFVDGGTVSLDGGTVQLQHAHQFSAGTTAQGIVVLPGGHPGIFLQWADPFGQAGDDYDLFIVDGALNRIAQSASLQDGNDFPVEQVVLDATGISSPVQLFVI